MQHKYNDGENVLHVIDLLMNLYWYFIEPMFFMHAIHTYGTYVYIYYVLYFSFKNSKYMKYYYKVCT